MQKLCKGILALVVVGFVASSAQAFWPDAFINHCDRGYKKNSRWPSPYICADRMYAHAPFQTMVRNGWRRQNLLGSHHFNAESTQLTQAGKLKIRWILTQAPPAYRQVFVEQGAELELTEQRLAAARDFSQQLAHGDTATLVVETHIISEGRPAGMVSFVNNQFRDNMRLPVLPVNVGEAAE
jgi:hypothetical protein